MLALVGLGLLVSRYWPDLGTAGRLAVTGTAAVLLLVGGALVRDGADPARRRLQAALWLAATAATGAFAVVAVRYGAGVDAAETSVLVAAAAVGLESLLLWRGRDLPVQQVTCLAAGPVVAGAAVAHVADTVGPPGLAVWAAGGVLLTAGLRRWLREPVLTEAVGAAALVVGAEMTAVGWAAFGLLLTMATGATLVAIATVRRLTVPPLDQVVLGAIGSVAMLQTAPRTLAYFADQAAAATGLLTYAAGAGVLLLGLRHLVRAERAAELVGVVLLFTGAAIVFGQWHGVAPVLGTLTAVGVITLGTLTDRFALSLLGCLGLLGNVAWTILWFFPGEGRVAVLTLVMGGLLLGLAVLLSRMGGGVHGGRPRHP